MTKASLTETHAIRSTPRVLNASAFATKPAAQGYLAHKKPPQIDTKPALQGYLAHKKPPPPLGPLRRTRWGPRPAP